MRYRLNSSVATKLKNIQTKFINLTTAVILAATTASGAAPLFFAGTAHAVDATSTYTYDFNGWTGTGGDN